MVIILSLYLWSVNDQPSFNVNPPLPDFHHPNRLCIALLGSQEIDPGRETGADTIASVNPHLPAGDVVEGEALGLMPRDHGEGGEGVGPRYYSNS